MAPRSIASLSISFGLVSVPVKLYSATESSAALRFKLMAASGARLKQQYIAQPAPQLMDETVDVAKFSSKPDASRNSRAGEATFRADSKVVSFPTPRPAAAPPESAREEAAVEEVIERSAMMKGYEYEKGKYVLFTPEELKALEAGSRQTIDIVSFIPAHAVDPIYYDKAYLLAPDKAGAKPYHLLLRAMADTKRCALGKWAFRSKEYVVQISPGDGGLVLQQLLYADEVRSLTDLKIEPTPVADAELELAKQLIEHIALSTYDPTQFVDEEKQRILAAVAEKIAGKELAAPAQSAKTGGQVVNLLEALRASLRVADMGGSAAAKTAPVERRPPKRAQPPKRAGGKSSGMGRAASKASVGKRN